MRVPELAWLEVFNGLATRYETHYGEKPLNLSHWDPSPEWEAISCGVRLSTTDVATYIYSELLDIHPSIRQKIGVSSDGKSSFLCNSGTAGIACALNYLKRMDVRKLHVISPSYYALDHQAAVFGITLERSFVRRRNRRYSLPAMAATCEPGSVIWVTNPIFCTSCYYGEEDLRLLNELLEAGVWVFADECLAMHGRELGRTLGHHERFVGIYTPHKSICINGMKFSVLIGPAAAHAAFQEWSDVFAGGLAVSTLMAVKHFLTAQYEDVQELVRRGLTQNLGRMQALLDRFSYVESDQGIDGHFTMCFIPHIRAEMGVSPEFLWNVISTSGSSFYPGIRNHFDPRWGFCFRTNLARYSPRFEASLHRVLLALGHNGT
jgi:histidinol-phosphate/aromatic aminotransferase/cobyric acid decarboxylase-like protein